LQIENKLLAETQLMPNEIDNIKYYVDKCVEEIERILNELKKNSCKPL
jgi:hypothetical protein